MSDAKTLEELAFPVYWDSRYATLGSEATFEWFKSFSTLRLFLEKHLPKPTQDGKSPKLLHLGCGNSTLPLDLVSLSYRNQVCVDFSTVVIQNMAARYSAEAAIVWQVMDVRHMIDFADSAFDIAIDKGTLDAMISGSLWDPPDEVRRNTKLYIDEVVRVLKPGGLFLYITYRQPHFVKPAIVREGAWTLHVENLLDPEGGTFEYFGYIMRRI